jgi:hypothetical protein
VDAPAETRKVVLIKKTRREMLAAVEQAPAGRCIVITDPDGALSLFADDATFEHVLFTLECVRFSLIRSVFGLDD